MARNRLTHSSLFNFLCRKAKDDKHLDHHVYDYLHHSCRPCESDIRLQSPEEVFDPFKEVNHCVLARANCLNRLKDLGVKVAQNNIKADTNREKSADAREDQTRRWISLGNRHEVAGLG